MWGFLFCRRYVLALLSIFQKRPQEAISNGSESLNRGSTWLTPRLDDITQTLPKDWRYISEGGATIVFAYGGEPNSAFDRRALRLRKAPLRASQGRDAEEMDTENPSDDEVEDDDSIVEFQDAVISRLIPSEYLQRFDHVRVSKPWLEALVALRNADRPPERMLKDKVDVTKTRAVLAMDLVGHQDLAVEIKPKWGFLPCDKHLSSTTRLIKTQTCRFCMHSYLKMSQGHPASRHYCPLDLFSGDRSRVTRAVQSLWKDWIESDGCLNNFHLFAHGLNIRPSDPGWLERLSGSVGHDLTRIQQDIIVAVVDLLMGAPILGILSKLQRELDVLDIEGLSELWFKTQESGESSVSPADMPDPTISDWMALVDAYHSSHTTKDHSQPCVADIQYYVHAYLLSATFKDCSIFVRLCRNSGGSWVGITANPITVIDLDTKKPKKLQRWAELDGDIVDQYAEVEGKRHCVDAKAEREVPSVPRT